MSYDVPLADTQTPDGKPVAVEKSTSQSDLEQAPSDPGSPVIRRAFEDPVAVTPPPAAPQLPPREREPERTLGELERDFLSAREKDVQIDLITEIAGHNDANAVQTLARLFPRGRIPEVKEAVLARLADIDASAAPAARLALLESALVGQPRNVRLTALDALADSDDPRALAVLRRAARDDPDQLLREAAAAFAEATEERNR